MPTVIKNQNAVDQGAVFNLADIAIEGRAIIEAARKKAAGIVAEAEASADAIREQARAAGHAEGLAAGTEQGKAEGREQAARTFDEQFARIGRALAEATDLVNNRKGRMLAEARQDMVALALAVAEKVVRCRLAADTDACRRTAEAAVELAGRATRLRLHVSPEDLQTLQEFAPKLAEGLTADGEVQVTADPEIERGGCRLIAWRDNGQAAEIDARIQTQLDRIAAEMLGKQDAVNE